MIIRLLYDTDSHGDPSRGSATLTGPFVGGGSYDFSDVTPGEEIRYTAEVRLDSGPWHEPSAYTQGGERSSPAYQGHATSVPGQIEVGWCPRAGADRYRVGYREVRSQGPYQYVEKGVNDRSHVLNLTPGRSYDLDVDYRQGGRWYTLDDSQGIRTVRVPMPTYTSIAGGDTPGSVTVAYNTNSTLSNIWTEWEALRYDGVGQGTSTDWLRIPRNGTLQVTHNRVTLLRPGQEVGVALRNRHTTTGETATPQPPRRQIRVPYRPAMRFTSSAQGGNVSITFGKPAGLPDNKVIRWEYRYKLATADAYPTSGPGSWERVAGRSAASISGLAPGDYNFQVRIRHSSLTNMAADEGYSLIQTANVSSPRPNVEGLTAELGGARGQMDVSWLPVFPSPTRQTSSDTHSA